jgi:archaeal cell division control protein 6
LENIIIDYNALREDHIPETIKFREEQLKEFNAFFFYGPTVGRSSSHLFIQGPPGTGKTLCTKYLIEQTYQQLETNGKKEDTLILYVNCTSCPTQLDTAKALFDLVKQQVEMPDIPKNIILSEVLKYTFKAIDTKYKQVLIVLDEVDKILPKRTTENDTLFYCLVRARELGYLKLANHNICCIANDVNCMSKLSEGTRDSFGALWVHFKRYDVGQLYGILSQRAEKAFNPGTISSDLLMKIAQHCQEEIGSARRAINLLKISADFATKAERKVILEEDFKRAKIVYEGKLVMADLNDMGDNQKITLYILCALFLEKPGYWDMPYLYQAYTKICKTLARDPKSERTVRSYYDDFIRLCMIEDYSDGSKTFYKPIIEPEIVKMLLEDFFLKYQIRAEEFYKTIKR